MNVERRYEILKDVADKYHSSIDRRSVVDLVVSYIEEISPVDLYSYGDNSLLLGIPTTDLLHSGLLDERREALLARRIVRGDYYTLFPIEGLQGFYGLVEVSGELSDTDVEFVSSLVRLLSKSVEDLYMRDAAESRIRMFQSINRIWLDLSECRRLADVRHYLEGCLTELFDADRVELSINRGDFLKDRRRMVGVHRRVSDMGEFDGLCDDVMRKRDVVRREAVVSGSEGTRVVVGCPFMRDHKVVGYAVIVMPEGADCDDTVLTLLSSIMHYASLILYNVILLEQLRERVDLDELTKLYTRSYLESQIERSLERDECGTFLILDIDNFKNVNDRYGHKEGDQVLVEVADIVRESIRDLDIAARWGGEEMVVYLPDSDSSSGVAVAERLVRAIREGTTLSVTVSCGVCSWSESMDYKDLFVIADRALYVAKNSGKDRYVVGHC